MRAGAPNRLSLLAGFALLLATGYTDAYAYLRHGHVFAEAMTGNLVLIGVGAADPTIVAFWRPLVSFAAFIAGVIVLTLVARADPGAPEDDASAQFATIAVQVLVLTGVGFLGRGFSQEAIVGLIAFAAGMQSAAFHRLGAARMSTVVMTTNSTQLVGALISALQSGDREELARSRALFVALAGFLAGVFCGAFASSTLHNRAAWVDASIFLIAGALYAEHHRQGRRAAIARIAA